MLPLFFVRWVREETTRITFFKICLFFYVPGSLRFSQSVDGRKKTTYPYFVLFNSTEDEYEAMHLDAADIKRCSSAERFYEARSPSSPASSAAEDEVDVWRLTNSAPRNGDLHKFPRASQTPVSRKLRSLMSGPAFARGGFVRRKKMFPIFCTFLYIFQVFIFSA